MNVPQPGDRFDRKASAARNKGGGDNHRRPPHGSDDRARCNRPGDAWRLLSNSWIFFRQSLTAKKVGGNNVGSGALKKVMGLQTSLLLNVDSSRWNWYTVVLRSVFGLPPRMTERSFS